MFNRIYNFYFQNEETETIMATLQQLAERVSSLDTTLQLEQLQVAKALEKLNTTISSLNVLLEDGGTAEERQAIMDHLDAIKADLEGTVEEPVEQPPLNIEEAPKEEAPVEKKSRKQK